MALVTIITATHYRPHCLYKLIKKVQQQSFQDYEHIIVGDHCPYAQSVYEQFASDTRIKFYSVPGKWTRNVGANSKNIGIENSTTDYITYIDDDNLPHNDFLEILYNNIIKEQFDVVISYFEYFYTIENGFDPEFNKVFDLIDINSRAVSQNDILTHIHKKSIYNISGLWKPWNHIGTREEDNNLINRILNNKDVIKIHYINDIVAKYYQIPCRIDKMKLVSKDNPYTKFLKTHWNFRNVQESLDLDILKNKLKI